jgi:hypothetical protein
MPNKDVLLDVPIRSDELLFIPPAAGELIRNFQTRFTLPFHPLPTLPLEFLLLFIVSEGKIEIVFNGEKLLLVLSE